MGGVGTGSSQLWSADDQIIVVECEGRSTCQGRLESRGLKRFDQSWNVLRMPALSLSLYLSLFSLSLSLSISLSLFVYLSLSFSLFLALSLSLILFFFFLRSSFLRKRERERERERGGGGGERAKARENNSNIITVRNMDSTVDLFLLYLCSGICAEFNNAKTLSYVVQG